MARIHYQIPDDLHREAKAAAATQGVTLKEFIEQALRLKVDAAGPPTRTTQPAKRTQRAVSGRQVTPRFKTGGS